MPKGRSSAAKGDSPAEGADEVTVADSEGPAADSEALWPKRLQPGHPTKPGELSTSISAPAPRYRCLAAMHRGDIVYQPCIYQPCTSISAMHISHAELSTSISAMHRGDNGGASDRRGQRGLRLSLSPILSIVSLSHSHSPILPLGPWRGQPECPPLLPKDCCPLGCLLLSRISLPFPAVYAQVATSAGHWLLSLPSESGPPAGRAASRT